MLFRSPSREKASCLFQLQQHNTQLRQVARRYTRYPPGLRQRARPYLRQLLAGFQRHRLNRPVKKKDKTLATSGYGIPIEKSEAYLRSVGLQGATVKELIKAVQPDAAVSSTASALDGSVNIIAMPGNRYVHIDSFVDLDEADRKSVV